MLDGSSLFTIEGLEIGGGHRWQTGLQKAKPNQPSFSFCSKLDTAMRGMTSGCSIVISENRKHYARLPDLSWIMRGVGGVASRSGPGAFLSENLEENPVAGELGPPPQFRGVLTPPPVLAPPMSCNRYVEHLNPQRTKASARPCRGRDPAEGWRFSGGRDSDTGSGARDPCGRPSESRVGRRVRIVSGEFANPRSFARDPRPLPIWR